MYLKKQRKFKFSYNKEQDDLFLFDPDSKSKGSIEWGDIVLDFNNKKELVALQFMHASTLIKDLTGEKDNQSIKKILQNLTESRMEIINKNNITIAKIYLISLNKEITTTLSVPVIKESSPALIA